VVLELCRRILADETAAAAAAEAAVSAAGARANRLELLAAVVAQCRARSGGDVQPAWGGHVQPASPPAPAAPEAEPTTLADAVAAELAAATRALRAGDRELLALRELAGLSHGEIARLTGAGEAAVAQRLARARLALRAALHGGAIQPGGCEAHDRALGVLARRQDGEAVAGEDEDWILAHMGRCPSCEHTHAAMLEASVCYRAWRPGR
jgi:hypothetical protein